MAFIDREAELRWLEGRWTDRRPQFLIGNRRCVLTRWAQPPPSRAAGGIVFGGRDGVEARVIEPVHNGVRVARLEQQPRLGKTFSRPFEAVANQDSALGGHNRTPSCSTCSWNGMARNSGEVQSAVLYAMTVRTAPVSSSIGYSRVRIASSTASVPASSMRTNRS